jgi:glutamate-5-semialdehyde dehydrogenase
MNVAIVEDVKAACLHMRRHGASHSDAILTDSVAHAEYFVNHADSACVYVNASTRFSDGGQFGLGAEVAISTQMLHARGPMGLDALTTYQWVLGGDYLSRK